MFTSDFVKIHQVVAGCGIDRDASINAGAVENFLRFLAFLSGFAQEGENLRQIFKDEDRQEVKERVAESIFGVDFDDGGKPLLSIDWAGDHACVPSQMPALEIFRAGFEKIVMRMAEEVIWCLEAGIDLPEPLMSLAPSKKEELRRWRSLIKVLKGDVPHWRCPPEYSPEEVVFEGVLRWEPGPAPEIPYYYLGSQRGATVLHVQQVHLRGQHSVRRVIEFFVMNDVPEGSVPQGVLTADGHILKEVSI